MKKCPFCSEEIQNEAIKCKHCGSFLTNIVQQPGNPVQQAVVPQKQKSNNLVIILVILFLGIPLGLLVLAVLGVLAVAVAPQFIDISKEAETSQYEGIKSAIRDGINMQYAMTLAETGNGQFPSKLDNNPNGPCKSCFDTVLQTGISDSFTKNDFTYTYKNGMFFTYDPLNGVLNEGK